MNEDALLRKTEKLISEHVWDTDIVTIRMLARAIVGEFKKSLGKPVKPLKETKV